MMKKAFPLLLSLVIVMQLCCVGCFAEDSNAWKNNTGTIDLNAMTATGNGVSISGKQITITQGGDFEVIGTLEDGNIYVNSKDKVKLRLSGTSITSSDGPAIYFANAKKAFITITENTENYLTDSSSYTDEDADGALFSNDDLEIKGAGTLTVTGNYKHGIAGDDDVVIENGTLSIQSVEHGIKANDLLQIIGGDITVTAKTGKGMKAGQELIIDDGTLNITNEQSEAMESKGTLTINGGTLNLTAADDGINTGNDDTETEDSGDAVGTQMQKSPRDEGDAGFQRPEGQPPGQMPNVPQQNGTMPEGQPAPGQGGMGRGGRFRDGDMQAPPQDGTDPSAAPPAAPDNNGGKAGGRGQMGGGFGFVDEETAAAKALTINGGNIYLNIKGDGIDSNGTLTINGGTIVIDGPTNSGNGPIDSDGAMTINGGTLAFASSAGMVQLPNGNDKQSILKLTFSHPQTAGTEVSVIAKESGNTLFAHTAANNFQCFIFSAAELEAGKDYTICVGGEAYETITATAGTASAGTATGGMGMGGRGQMGGGRGQMHANSQVKVNVNGKRVSFDTAPVVKNDTTLVGFRSILETLGATVGWDEATQTVTAERDGTTILLVIGSTQAYVNGQEKTLLTAPEIINDSTMIPVRFISEQLGMKVDWDEANQLVSVTEQ